MVSPRWLSGVTDMQVFGDQVSNPCSFKLGASVLLPWHTQKHATKTVNFHYYSQNLVLDLLMADDKAVKKKTMVTDGARVPVNGCTYTTTGNGLL